MVSLVLSHFFLPHLVFVVGPCRWKIHASCMIELSVANYVFDLKLIEPVG